MTRHKTVGLLSAVGAGLIAAFTAGNAARAQDADSIKLNVGALEYAKQLIAEGRIVADRHGSWAEHQPSPDHENRFIQQYGFEGYGKWHLGLDLRRGERTKARYKFPFGDLTSVHRCALLAVESRARQHHHAEIEKAVAELKEMMRHIKTSNDMVER